MKEMIEVLQYYLAYPFVRYAFVVGILVALCASLLGVSLVLKRYSFIGDGLSHVAFGAMAIATVLNMANQTILIMPVTALAAVFILKTGKKTRINGDAIIAMLSVGALAVGYLLMNVFSTSANVSGDVCSTLFGATSILTLTQEEVVTCAVMSMICILFFIAYYHHIFAVTFDEDFTKAIGKKVEIYNFLIAIITAMIIVLAMNLVGSLLTTALLIFPALSAMRIMRSFLGVILYSAVISVVSAFVGIVVSVLCSTPVGATIVVFHILIYFVNYGIGCVLKR